jgi:hypothetical protein
MWKDCKCGGWDFCKLLWNLGLYGELIKWNFHSLVTCRRGKQVYEKDSPVRHLSSWMITWLGAQLSTETFVSWEHVVSLNALNLLKTDLVWELSVCAASVIYWCLWKCLSVPCSLDFRWLHTDSLKPFVEASLLEMSVNWLHISVVLSRVLLPLDMLRQNTWSSTMEPPFTVPWGYLAQWNDYCISVFFLLFFCETEVWTQGLHAYKTGALLLQPHLQSVLLWLFWRWDMMIYLPRLALNFNPPNLSLPSS